MKTLDLPELPLGPPRAGWLALEELLGRPARPVEGDFPPLASLARAAPGELRHLLGLTPGGARRLAAAFRLALALEAERQPERPRLDSPAAVERYLRPRFRGLEQEQFLGLLLDGRHRLRRVYLVSRGTLTTSLVHPREVFRPALREAAAALIVAHNHPSGDSAPSREDIEVTRRLEQVGELVGVPLLDHVVIGRAGDFTSLRERRNGLRERRNGLREGGTGLHEGGGRQGALEPRPGRPFEDAGRQAEGRGEGGLDP